MSSVDLKVVGVTVMTLVAYTVVANVIPQVQSEVPADIAFGADVTAEELVDAGRQLYEGAGGCVACHAETPGARAPNLRTDYRGRGPIGVRCADRVPGLNCKEYLYQALVRPQDDMVDDYPPIMPPVDRTLSQPQIWALVAYLEAQGGEVTVTAADIPDEPAPGADPAAPVAAGPSVATTDPEEILRSLCVMCHQLGEEGTPLGPPFNGIGGRISSERIRMAILDPAGTIAEGYEDFAGLMPPTFGEQLTATQLESIVRYLSELR